MGAIGGQWVFSYLHIVEQETRRFLEKPCAFFGNPSIIHGRVQS